MDEHPILSIFCPTFWPPLWHCCILWPAPWPSYYLNTMSSDLLCDIVVYCALFDEYSFLSIFWLVVWHCCILWPVPWPSYYWNTMSRDLLCDLIHEYPILWISDLYFDLPCDIAVFCELLQGHPIISILCLVTSCVTFLYIVTWSMNILFSKYSDLYFDLPCDIVVFCDLLHDQPILQISWSNHTYIGICKSVKSSHMVNA